MLTPERIESIFLEHGWHWSGKSGMYTPIGRAIEAEVRKDFADALEAQEAEIARLNKAIHYEQNYLTRIGTHGPDCWKWGPQHYQCAVAEIARREAAIKERETNDSP